jgi:hypothetical protein
MKILNFEIRIWDLFRPVLSEVEGTRAQDLISLGYA